MPNTDDTPASHPTTRPRLQPSLLGEGDAPGRAGPNSDLGQMRMLDELEAVVRPRAAVRASPVSGWLVAVLGTGVVLAAAAWWWNHQGNTTPRALPKTLALGSAPAQISQAAVVSPVLVAASAVRAALTEQGAVPDPASAAARIETMVAAPPAPAPATEPAIRPVSVAAPAARPASRAPNVAVAKADPKAPADKITTVLTPSGKWTVTVADEARALTPRGAAAAPKPNDKALANPAASVARADAARNPKAEDADVLLLSALLAHVSRTDANGALPEQDQITIAQLVKRCDARAPDEARECRRRICEGYWGKAEACPARVAPR